MSTSIFKEEAVTKISGVLSAMVTPFYEADENLDEATLRALTERTIEAGIHGLIPCGSTGEFAALTLDERRLVTEVVIDQTAGRVPVIPHVGAMTTSRAIALAEHAESKGAAGLMAVSPYYEALTTLEIKHYFRDLANSTSLPIMIYNLPGATGTNFGPSDVAELAVAHKNIQYVKDTTGNFSQAGCLIHDYADVITSFVGHDTFFFAALAEGATGAVLGAANFIAAELVGVWDAAQAGEYAAAKSQWDAVFDIMQFLVNGGYVAGVRGALDILGLSAGPARLPIEPLPLERRVELESLLKPFVNR